MPNVSVYIASQGQKFMVGGHKFEYSNEILCIPDNRATTRVLYSSKETGVIDIGNSSLERRNNFLVAHLRLKEGIANLDTLSLVEMSAIKTMCSPYVAASVLELEKPILLKPMFVRYSNTFFLHLICFDAQGLNAFWTPLYYKTI